ncbi:uncharacterized protein TNIN_334361 [Trichonephila inaurata madagascariensis]|uniref:Uncharacterized protein n=1 Tax=Trichonephila inaurata madagascariensis TaxID=2747483 RepID=A0A8X6XSI3_9ARAC|nr:uncharacterized protein TNIN_334361 [Trichonephila inaurata madagascariensis]
MSISKVLALDLSLTVSYKLLPPDSGFLYHYVSDDEEPIDICQLLPEESGCLTDEEDIDEDTFQSVLLADVCGKIEISTNIDNDEISKDMFDPEEL